MPAVRMKEVAARCHVSIKTVSNVINRLPNVGEETRRAVLERIRHPEEEPSCHTLPARIVIRSSSGKAAE